MKSLRYIFFLSLLVSMSHPCLASATGGTKIAEFNQQQLHAIKIIKVFRSVANSPELSNENRSKVESAYNNFLARYQDISDDKTTMSGNDRVLENCSKRLDVLIADMKQFIN